ncbi:16S rRNA (uracil(1498)-N(3))-methyltransferase [Maribacter sp. TH_r10]|uniref:Ribosomal RNA small subunit methyltransferase E n=1 Tax=Maribacter luteus TaxID=2594478 RepID=A0A6I2MIX6_9FLAO|nr:MULTISPECIES: 16S rRNA (uracil(1498)-N(3))-methyltransferase [Maribacter]MDV7140087.1 16S rRNA (uracil(1498)-N(3))-methyltransferase [Maribacter sp. TH_r10]MRX63793.1 16S rRNA (uracil(1498)-N(3))-methyltransferase [Maribacter luteus]
MQLFYYPKLDNSTAQFVFTPEESHHIVKVLRKKENDTLLITNGKGRIFEAKILLADAKKCKAQITSTKKKHRKMYWFHLVVAPTKSNDRFEWFLEKATEIGIDEITPIICDRSERKVIKPERMEKVLQSAMKQSMQAYLPKLNPAVTYNEFIEQEREGLLFIAHCEDDEKMELKRRVAPDKDITILIGPEGDFSRNEIDKAYEKGFLPVSLGQNRLRTETAAIVACTTVNLINNG